MTDVYRRSIMMDVPSSVMNHRIRADLPRTGAGQPPHNGIGPRACETTKSPGSLVAESLRIDPQ